MPLFTFHTPVSEQDSLQALLDVETKNWSKEAAAAKQSGAAFDKAKPELDALKTAYRGDGEFSAEDLFLRYATQNHADTPLKENDAKRLGAALLQLEKNLEARHQLHPELSVKGSDGKEYPLEPKELSGWLQASASDGKTPGIAVEKWVADHNISLTGMAHPIMNGSEKILIETAAGQRRVVGNGILAEPMGGHYGGIDGVKVGDGDLLDVYISTSVHDGMTQGKPYKGAVFVMQQMDKGKNDELKIGYAKNVDEFQSIMTSSWKNPDDFKKLNEGKYIEIDHAQYEQLKSALKEKPTLTLDEFVEKLHLDPKAVERKPEGKPHAATIIPDSLKGLSADTLDGSITAATQAVHHLASATDALSIPAQPRGNPSRGAGLT